MGWIKVLDSVIDDAKLRNLRKLLALKNQREALGYVVMLWIFTQRKAWLDGNLEPFGAEGIEDAVLWDGEPGAFVRALRDCGKTKDGKRGPGLLDGWTVHDWVDISCGPHTPNYYRRLRADGNGSTAPLSRLTEQVVAPSSQGLRPSGEDIHSRAKRILKERGIV